MSLKKTVPAEMINVPSYDFVSTFIANTYKQVTKYGGIKHDGHLASWDEVELTLEIARSSMGKKAYPERAVDTAFALWCLHKDRKHEVDIINSLSYTGPSDALDTWLLALIGPNRPHYEIHRAVLEHFIWQVKRKMHGLPVSYHMMPVVVGPTGSGKSRALARLLEPLADLVESGMDFSVFAQENHWHVFGEKYVMFFDEMAKARKADIESLKNTITAPEKTYRKFYLQANRAVKQNCTFIGASNDPVCSLIVDSTSARRFWEYQTGLQCDWATINSVNCLQIWQSVDESQELPPIMPYLPQISEIQNSFLRAKSNSELWFEESAATTTAGNGTKVAVLYEAFKEWEARYDEKAKTSMRGFALRLADIAGVQRIIKNNETYYNVELKAKAAPKGQVLTFGGK